MVKVIKPLSHILLGKTPIRMGCIYMLISPSGKCYIGKTIQDVLQRWKAHKRPSSNCPAISNAINKYGWENFTKSVIDWAPENELDNLEQYYIKLHNSMAPNGYNLTEGGDGGRFSEETRKKVSDGLKKHYANRPQFGSVHFCKINRKWKVVSAKPERNNIGLYFTEKKAREALNHYNNTGERMESDTTKRKYGTGSVRKKRHRYQAKIQLSPGERKSKTFDTAEQCEEWLLKIRNNIL